MKELGGPLLNQEDTIPSDQEGQGKHKTEGVHHKTEGFSKECRRLGRRMGSSKQEIRSKEEVQSEGDG